jgi:predicted RNA-binding protein YlqC (UPF0109 family)
VTQADQTGYDDGGEGTAGRPLTDDADMAEEGNRAIAPVANAVLGHIARSIVDDPEAVEIETIPLRAGKVRLAVRVAPNDFGRLIGRRGRVAAAVRTLVGAAAVRDGLDVEVEFVE